MLPRHRSGRDRRSRLYGGNRFLDFAIGLLPGLAEKALSPIISAVGEKVGNWIHPKKAIVQPPPAQGGYSKYSGSAAKLAGDSRILKKKPRVR